MGVWELVNWRDGEVEGWRVGGLESWRLVSEELEDIIVELGVEGLEILEGFGELVSWWVGESENIIVENKAEGLKISFLYLKKH